MILIAIGANLPNPRNPTPLAACEAVIEALGAAGVRVLRRSRWYRSAPVPASVQPWFINGVVRVDAEPPSPGALLGVLHRIERDFGRRRRTPGAARAMDLDLLDWDGRVSVPGDAAVLPHPRLHERAFVLLPLAEVAPEWRHPTLGRGVADLIAALPPDQTAQPVG